MKRSVFNQKGGVGKTSITCNLAAAMADQGRKVLVVDLDAQSNATQYLLGRGADEVTHTIADFFASTLSFSIFKDSLREAIYKTPFDNLWVIPASRELSELQPKLEGRYKILKLREAIDSVAADMGFDEILFDTPPALNFYSMSALIASEGVLIPFDCDAFSAEALVQVMNIIREVSEDHRPELKAEGVIINHFQAQAKLPLESIQKLNALGYPILKPYLSTSIVMRESHAEHVPLVAFKPKHKLALEFSELAQSLIEDKTATGRAKSKPRSSKENPSCDSLN